MYHFDIRLLICRFLRFLTIKSIKNRSQHCNIEAFSGYFASDNLQKKIFFFATTLVATSAFGMDIDVQDIEVVIRFDTTIRKSSIACAKDSADIERSRGYAQSTFCDQTRDRYFDHASKVALWLGIFQKLSLMPHYAAVPFPQASEYDGKWKGANQHAWTTANRSCAFSVYDKAYELKKRHKVKIKDHILRLELRLSRKRICKL